jgi:hypothetical protein
VSNPNEDHLRPAELDSTDAPEAHDPLAQAKQPKPGEELHLDDEQDTLFEDGLEVDDESLTLAGTQGNPNKG